MSEADAEFDPADPYNAMCESFRLQVIQMMDDGQRITIFRDLPPDRQLSALMAGTLSGVLGVAFCMVEDRDAVIKGIVEALPHLRRQTESILDT